MEGILNLMNKYYMGKTFVYKSKHGGRTEGLCEKVVSYVSFICNEEFESFFKTNLGNIKNGEYGGTPNNIKGELTKDNFYFANQIVYQVISSKGITYDLTEIYFKN